MAANGQQAEAQEQGHADGHVDVEVEVADQQPQPPAPLTIRLPSPNHGRTLPTKRAEDFSKLTLAPQSHETIQELKLSINEWVGGYWLGPYSLRLPKSSSLSSSSNGDEVKKGKDGVEIRQGEKLSEWLEIGDVFDNEYAGERILDVVREPYSDFSARQTVLRLLELIAPAGTTSNHLSTPIGLQPGSTIFEYVRDGTVASLSGPFDPVFEEVEVSLPSGRKGKLGKKELVKVKRELTADQDQPFADWKDWKEYSLSQIPFAQPLLQTQPCVKAIQLSPFNPPPAHLRQAGHQLYLQISTLEGENATLVCASRGWYISKSNINTFDPTPKGEIFHSLVDLLHSISPQFSERLGKLSPLSTSPLAFEPISTVPVPQAEPAYPYLARVPKPSTTAEILRSQLAYLHTGATTAEGLDAARDWNEEIQGIKELPKEDMQQRVLREKMFQKTMAEFNQASQRAVLNISSGDIPPLNPNEQARAHMWLISNIFITKAVDSIDAYAHLGGDAAALVSHAKDAAGVKILHKLDIDGIHLLGHTVVDWQGERWVCQTMLPGIFARRKEEEDWVQVESSTNDAEDDGKATGAATTNGHGEGHVNGESAESEAEIEDEAKTEDNPLIIYGMDSEHHTSIHWDEATHRVMEKVAVAHRLAAHKVKDGKGVEREFYASAEVKGLRGTDGRRYLLDLPRLSPVDVEWLEKDIEGYPHRVVLLRPELLETFWESELKRYARELTSGDADAETAADEKIGDANAEAKPQPESAGGEGEQEKETAAAAAASEVKEAELNEKLKNFDLRFNPDAFVDQPQPKGSKETTFVPSSVTDESDLSIKAVRDASVFLRTVAIPAIVVDSLTGNLSGIMDGASLSRHLHSRGVNIRYLGQLISRIDKFSVDAEGNSTQNGYLKSLRAIAVQETIFRASKHIIRRLIKGLQPEHIACAVAHFLNCLLGSTSTSAEGSAAPTPKATYNPIDLASSSQPEYVSLSPESLRKELVSQIETRYRFALDEGAFTQGTRTRQLLREIASRFAFQLLQKDYDFTSSSPFASTDILTMLPVIKSTAPSVSVAEEILDAGRATINRGNMGLGLDFMLEAIQLYENIHSVIHPEVAAAYNQYASTLHQLARIKFQQFAAEGADADQPLGLDITTGLRLQRQAVMIAERTLGVYSAETAGYYFNLAMLENLEGNAVAALRYFRHGLTLWDVIHGPGHPEINTLLSNAGIVLQALSHHASSLSLLTLSTELTTQQFGSTHLQTAQTLHQLTQAHFLNSDLPSAYSTSQAAYGIFKERLGEDHAQTKEVEKNVELLKSFIEGRERQKAAKESEKERLKASMNARLGNLAKYRTIRAGAGTGAGAGAGAETNGANANAPTALEGITNAGESSATGAAASHLGAGAGADGSKIGERGHLDVDELVKYIQGGGQGGAGAGGGGAKRGKNALRGKRRTGAKR